MALNPGFLSKNFYCYESTLGTMSGSGSLWPSWEPDSLVIGDKNIERSGLVCTRFSAGSDYGFSFREPTGCPGAIPLFFNSDGSHRPILQILDTHFQNFAYATPVGARASTYIFTPQLEAYPTAWHGMTFIKDVGITGQTFSWHGGVSEELTISWSYGNPIMIRPTYQFLRGTDVACGSTVGSSIPTMGILSHSYMSMQWNGATIHPVAFAIHSKNDLMGYAHMGSLERTGFALGGWTGRIELSLWNDDDFGSYFINNYRTSSIGTITFQFNGSSGTYATGTAFGIYGSIYGKVKIMPALASRRANMPEKVIIDMVSTYGTASPFQFVVFSDYSDSENL